MLHTTNCFYRPFSLFVILGLLFAALPALPAAAQDVTETDVFFEDFSDNSANWFLQTEWEIGPATASSGQEYGNPDPAFDHTPTNDNGVAGVVIGGNAATTPSHNCYYIISKPFDASAPGILTLEFYRWLNSDYNPHMQNKIQVWNGAAWMTLWKSSYQPGITDSQWTKVTFDLTKYKNSAMRLRFSFNVAKAEPWSVSSWNLDDIRVFTTNTLTANDDVYSVTKNGRLAPPAPGVLGNDRDPNNRNLIANLVSGTSHGTLTFQHNGTFVYQPEQNYLGQDSFVYELVAGTDKDTALVTINVVNPNQVPVANDLTVSTHKDTPLVRPLTGSDGDGDLLDFSIKLLPAHGTITLARDATFTYTPNPGYTGPDAFTFTVSDGKASDTGQVTISVTP